MTKLMKILKLKKVKQLYHNEENVDFDKSKTLRILFRKSPRKHDLE